MIHVELEEIKQLVAENSKQIAENSKQITENSKQITEVWNLFKEVALKQVETDKVVKNLSEEIDKTSKNLSEEIDKTSKNLSEEIDKTSKNLSEEIDKTSKKLSEEVRRVSKDVEALKDKWSHFVENTVRPGLIRIFQEKGIILKEVSQRVQKHDEQGRVAIEIDLLAINTEYVVVVEVKSSLSSDDVKEHIQRIGKFKSLFPAYQAHKVIGAVAGIVINKEASRFAYQKGLYVIGQAGNDVAILNNNDFKPRMW